MTKTVLKEIVIILLLLIAIVLILGIMLYDYIPNNVTPPVKVQPYELPSEVQDELNETLEAESQNIVKTYFVDSSTLSTYEYNDNYDKGKVDPFSSYKTTTSTPAANTSTNNSSTNFNTNGSNANSVEITSETDGNSQSTGSFFNTTGKN